MLATDAVELVNTKFQYKTDSDHYGFHEVWRVMADKAMVGDCEDYALTVLWLMAGKSIPKMLWWLTIRKARIYHYTHRDKGTGHAGLWFKRQGYVDNQSRRWNDGKYLKEVGYKRWRISWPVTVILMKFLIGGIGSRIARMTS